MPFNFALYLNMTQSQEPTACSVLVQVWLLLVRRHVSCGRKVYNRGLKQNASNNSQPLKHVHRLLRCRFLPVAKCTITYVNSYGLPIDQQQIDLHRSPLRNLLHTTQPTSISGRDDLTGCTRWLQTYFDQDLPPRLRFCVCLFTSRQEYIIWMPYISKVRTSCRYGVFMCSCWEIPTGNIFKFDRTVQICDLTEGHACSQANETRTFSNILQFNVMPYQSDNSLHSLLLSSNSKQIIFCFSSSFRNAFFFRTFCSSCVP